jgi:hypothetical protein
MLPYQMHQQVQTPHRDAEVVTSFAFIADLSNCDLDGYTGLNESLHCVARFGSDFRHRLLRFQDTGILVTRLTNVKTFVSFLPANDKGIVSPKLDPLVLKRKLLMLELSARDSTKTGRWVAEQLGVHESEVSRVINGAKRGNKFQVQAIQKFLARLWKVPVVEVFPEE